LFKPLTQEMKVNPGQMNEVVFMVRNTTEQAMIAQAVPSVSPSEGASYFHKTECFCFNAQPLAAGEEARLPLRFYVDPALPSTLHTLTLSYTLFDVSNQETVSSTLAQPGQS